MYNYCNIYWTQNPIFMNMQGKDVQKLVGLHVATFEKC